MKRSGREATVITVPDGVKFHAVPTRYRQVFDVPDYTFHDIRPSDIVLDVGANVGAFAIRAARLSRNVVAVEPVTCDLLEANVRLNNVRDRIRVIRGALGIGGTEEVRWDDEAATVPMYTLKQLTGMAGGCDFLKCDCEGAEWAIDPRDLAGIRRIEMELHLPPICGRPEPALLDAIGREFEFTIERRPCHGPMGLMGYLHAERRE
jgi:FkbM family methyltransferase